MSLFERLNSMKRQKPQESRDNIPENTANAVAIPGGKVVNTRFGEYILLEETSSGSFPFPRCGELKNNLRLIRGIGPVNEGKLKEQGYFSIDQLMEHPRWKEQACQVKELIEDAEIKELCRMGAADWDLLSFFNPGDVVFLDIESTGLWASQPLFLVGVMYYNSGNLVVEQYFARHYKEEKAVLAAVDGLLKEFKVVVTYNGKCFDMPYITQRTVAQGLYRGYGHYHVDLLYHARKHFRNRLPDCRLMTLEKYLLNFQREGDIPGYLIPQTYHRFVKTGDESLVRPIIEHNKLDLLAMARIFGLVNPECSTGLAWARVAAASEL